MQGLFVLLPTLLFAVFAGVVVWVVNCSKSRHRASSACQSMHETLTTDK